MAVPKKKTSQSRRDKRRHSNRWTLSAVNTVSCSNCGAPVRQHRVCESCGHYSGRSVAHARNQDV